MRNLWLLTRFLFKCGLGNANKKKKTNISSILVGLLIAVCMVPLMGALFGLGYGGYGLFSKFGVEGTIPQLACVMGGMVILFFGISTVISIFYMTSDIESLLPLPVQAWQIVGAKTLMALLYEYLWMILFVIPILLGYGIAAGAGVSYWLFGFIGCIFLPIVPLVYAGLISMIIMRVFKRIRNKDFLSMAGFFVSLVLIFVINGASQFFNNAGTDIVKVLTDPDGIAAKIGYLFPTFRFMSGAMLEGSVLQMLIFIVTALAMLAVFWLIAQRIYFKGVLGMTESSSKKHVLTREERRKASKVKTPVYSYLLIEWRKLLRTPIYMFNCVLMALIWPLILMIPLISMFGSGALVVMFSTGGFMEEVNKFLASPACFGVMILAAAALGLMVTSMNEVASTSISREGSNYYVMKYLPISYRNQIKAKIASGAIISIIGSVFYIIIIDCILIFMGLNPLVLPLSLVIDVLAVLLLTYIQMLMDLVYPKLDWENEAMAVKQNFHAAIAVFIGFGLCFVICGGAVLLYLYLHVPAYILVIAFTILMAVVTFVIRRITYNYGEKKLASLEA